MNEHGDYCRSFESCYPLFSEPGKMLVEEAKKMGIEAEGESKLEIAEEVFRSNK